MTRIAAPIAGLMSILLLLSTTVPAQTSDPDGPGFEFEVFSVPGQGLILGSDINDAGDIVGMIDDFTSGAFRRMGFVRQGNTLTLIDPPDAEPLNGSRANGINNAGKIVGRFTDPWITTHGYTYDGGVLEPFDVPDSWFTDPLDINNHGVIVGRTFLNSNPGISTAFILAGGEYSFFRPDGALAPFGIELRGVNDHNTMVGQVLDRTGFRAFAILDGVYMPFSIPGSTRTIASGINNRHQIVGTFYVGSATYGFLMDWTGIYRIDPMVPSAVRTYVDGLNEGGVLVGAVEFFSFPVREVLVGTPCEQTSTTCLPAPRIGDPSISFARQIEIDIAPPRLNPDSRGVIPVAILGSSRFDISDVDVMTLAFGTGAAPAAHDLTDPLTLDDHAKDVNGDGFADLVVHFRTPETGIACGDTDAMLFGLTTDGRPFEGVDAFATVGCDSIQR